MSLGLVGRKCGMTRVFCEDGTSIPVTVLRIERNRITQVKSKEKEGYEAIQVAYGEKKSSNVTKSLAGHYVNAGTTAGRGLHEFRINELDDASELNVGYQLPLDIFSVGQLVDVKGVSIGKGFAGAVKRHNFSTQDATHGNSRSHRVLGSIGMNQTPGRVFKGKKMDGHMGARNVTVQNLVIQSIDCERSIVMIRGAIPGSVGSDVIILPASKAKRRV